MINTFITKVLQVLRIHVSKKTKFYNNFKFYLYKMDAPFKWRRQCPLFNELIPYIFKLSLAVSKA